MINKKGFVLILVVVFLSLLIMSALVIMNLGCGDLLNARTMGDITSANYVAMSGAELMYGRLKSMEGQMVSWPQTMSSADSTVNTLYSGGTQIGTFSITANAAGTDTLGMVSTGNVNGKTARVAVRYGFTSSFTNGYPIGSIGNMSLSGQRSGGQRSWVRAEGPLASKGTISTNNFVQVSGSLLEHQGLVAPSFWQKYDAFAGTWSSKQIYDTNGNNSFVPDPDNKGYVELADCGGDAAQEAIFSADDINSDGLVNEKDAFISYYTVELNKLSLNIGLGQSYYYSGNQVFDPASVPVGTPIIFVDGNVDIEFNDTEWWGSACDHTIIATGDITIIQPTNGSNDTLTLVAWGDVNTGGVHSYGGIQGNMTVYANGDFNAYYGGRTNGTVFTKGEADIDTVLVIPGLLNRDFNRGKEDWSNPANWPLGLPPNYNMMSLTFRIKNERTQFVPIWQRE
jgi:hypothetical protein